VPNESSSTLRLDLNPIIVITMIMTRRTWLDTITDVMHGGSRRRPESIPELGQGQYSRLKRLDGEPGWFLVWDPPTGPVVCLSPVSAIL
jgi:hypothetical protein